MSSGSEGSLQPAIARIWRGRTKPERADEDLSRGRKDESEFVTISYWKSVESMSNFTGGDPVRIHHLESDAEFLIELPKTVQILKIRTSHGQTSGNNWP